jgi:hypothetical protein
MKLWCDSKSMINIASNPVQNDITKHVEINRFLIKEKLESGLLERSHVVTENQVADCLTKGLNSLDLVTLCDNGLDGYLLSILRRVLKYRKY